MNLKYVKMPLLEDLLTFGEKGYNRFVEDTRKKYLRTYFPDTCSVMTGIFQSLFKIFILILMGGIVGCVALLPWPIFVIGFLVDGVIPFTGFTNDMTEMGPMEAFASLQLGVVFMICLLAAWMWINDRLRKTSLKDSILVVSVHGFVNKYCRKVEW